jgi:hypothetical protein
MHPDFVKEGALRFPVSVGSVYRYEAIFDLIAPTKAVGSFAALIAAIDFRSKPSIRSSSP